jgi:hypothetical protein
LFPTIGANGPCQVHVNLGQRGFLFIEANVKKWGLAPSQGTLSPPPAYGTERDTVLLAMGSNDTNSNAISIDMNGLTNNNNNNRPPPYSSHHHIENNTTHQQRSSLLD